MLTKYHDCPVNSAIPPASPICLRCKFFKTFVSSSVTGDKHIICDLDTAKTEMCGIIGKSTINSPIGLMALKIIEMLIEKQIIKEK